MMFRSLVFAAVSVLCAGAQEQPNLFNSAPPEQDKALRERVAGFYQAYVEGKFRSSEQFVAEDTKDLHYNQEKTKIGGFEIVKINWDDGFKKASVVTTIQTSIKMRGQDVPASAPMATRWKLEDGKWMYYVDPTMGRPTPMGMMKPGPGNRQGMNFDEMLKNPNVILNELKVSKEKFLLRGWEESSDSLVITNGMPGSVTLSLQTESISGLTHKIEKTELGPGETSRIEMNYLPKDKTAKPTLKASLLVEPFGRTIIIPIVFDIPDEVKKQLPKQ